MLRNLDLDLIALMGINSTLLHPLTSEYLRGNPNKNNMNCSDSMDSQIPTSLGDRT